HAIDAKRAAAYLLSASLRTIDCQLRVRTDALPVVKIEQHGRTLGSGHQKVLELAQRVRADHVTLVSGDHVAVRTFADENIEVVVPEVSHHFVELALAVDGAQQFCG